MIFLVIAFIVVPLVELYVIIKVGGAIGIGPTIALLLIDSLLGAFLLRHQGRAAWVAFNRAMAESRLPAKEVLDGVLIIFGGALLLTPGFITDIVGLCLLIPPTRAIVRTFLKWLGISRLSWGPKAAVWGYGRMQKDRGRRRGAAPGQRRAAALGAAARPAREPRTSAGRAPGRGRATSRAPPTRCATTTRRCPRAGEASLPRMSGGGLVCGFWDEASGLAGLGWTLGGSSGGLLLGEDEVAPAAAEIEDRGRDGPGPGGAGGPGRAELRPRPSPSPLAGANGAGSLAGEGESAPCVASVTVGGASARWNARVT